MEIVKIVIGGKSWKNNAAWFCFKSIHL